MQRAREAAGGDAWDQVALVAYDGNEDSSGMKGQIHVVQDLQKSRIRRESDFHVVRVLEVWDGLHHWRQEVSGGVHPLDSQFAKQASATDEWLAHRAYLKQGAGNATLGAVESRSDSGKPTDVLTATPVNGQPVELWFDAATHLLVRTVRVMPTTVETTAYSDYRPVGRVLLPRRILTEDGEGSVDAVNISEYNLNPEINVSTFQAPVTPDDTVVNGGKSTVPIELDGYIILEARLNGRGPFAFLFDTGGHDILTPEAAVALGLQPAGAGSAGGAGSDRLSVQYAKVKSLEIGGVLIRNQNFFVIPLQYDTVERGQRPPLAGILGLELLERLAIRLDYSVHTMTFWPKDEYQHSGPGQSVAITFSDDIPLLTATLDGAAGDFALDTGNGGSLVVQHLWAERHDLADRLKRGVEMVSFGSGGETRNWASRIAELQIAGVTLHNLVGRYVEDKHGAFSSRTEAGNLGTDVLANFTLDFDYSRGQIWFESVPGYTSLPFPRGGMSFSKSSPDSADVVYVVEGGPAAQAGLRKGDTLIEVAGKSVKILSRRDLLHIFTQPPGTSVPITYNREGHRGLTTLVLRELLP